MRRPSRSPLPWANHGCRCTSVRELPCLTTGRRDCRGRCHSRSNSNSQFEQLFPGCADSTGRRRTGAAARCPRRIARTAPSDRRRPEGRPAADDRRSLHGPLRSGRASAVGIARRIFLHRREESSRDVRSSSASVVRAFASHSAREKPATYFFGLPGNPVSTMVTFELFARPMLEALAGESPRKLDISSRASEEGNSRQDRSQAISPRDPFRRIRTFGSRIGPWQGSGDIAATARANCYIVIPADRERIPAGRMGRGDEKQLIRLLMVD